jgi:hypothetical protein
MRAVIILALLLAVVLPAAAGKKKVVPEPYGLVAGSVFRDSGYALPSAEITLVPNPPPNTPPVKMKKLQAVSDARGEFVFRVPAASMSYLVKVAAKGFHGEEKPVTIQGEERVDVTFMLHEESK